MSPTSPLPEDMAELAAVQSPPIAEKVLAIHRLPTSTHHRHTHVSRSRVHLTSRTRRRPLRCPRALVHARIHTRTRGAHDHVRSRTHTHRSDERPRARPRPCPWPPVSNTTTGSLLGSAPHSARPVASNAARDCSQHTRTHTLPAELRASVHHNRVQVRIFL